MVRVAQFAARSALLAALVLGAWMPRGVRAETAARPPAKADRPARLGENDPQAIEVLQQMERLYAGVGSIAGRFRQARTDGLPGSPAIESDASFWMLKPDKFRADYEKPSPFTVLIADRCLYRHTPELKQVERYQFQDRDTPIDLNYMLLGFGQKTEAILRVYKVRRVGEGVPEGHVGIRLVPRDPGASSLKWLSIVLTNDGRYLPVEFSMEEVSGALVSARMHIKTLKLGGRIDERVFVPAFKGNPQVVDIGQP